MPSDEPATPEPTAYEVRPVATVHCGRARAVDDDWGAVTATIELLAPFDGQALVGLEEFSHIEVLFVFHGVDPAAATTGARHPRGNRAWPEVGIFAQRAKDRPNRLGLSTCEVVAVEGSTVVVRGLDAIDGTPVLDIKPVMAGFAPRGVVRQPPWSHELMAGYW
ncbi:MAG: SAM-dependent methyltransferase [Acidimicrobiales bacterium]